MSHELALFLPWFAGLSLIVLGVTWLIAAAFQAGWRWGLGVLLVIPALPFAGRNWRLARDPVMVIGLGAVLLAVGQALRIDPVGVRRAVVGFGEWLMREDVAVILLLAGGLIAAVGFGWLVVAAFRTSRPWGAGVLLFPPLGVIFALKHPGPARRPLALLAAGLIAATTPIVLNRYVFPIDLGPRERIVDGERHLTLTGWDQKDYRVLSERPDVVVLQMANPDVTDAVVRRLEGSDRLRELDLNGSAVTDACLPALASLPALEVLKIRDTKVSDEGFRAHLAERPALRLLDLRGTGVTAETVRAWRAGKPGRRALR